MEIDFTGITKEPKKVVFRTVANATVFETFAYQVSGIDVSIKS